jgi:hypothetical protein
MPTGFPDLTPEQVKAFIDGIGGSTSIDVADPILNPGMIIDNPKAVYDKLNQNAYVANKFKNKLVFEGVVLLKIKTQSEFSLFSAITSLLPFVDGQDSDSTTFFFCYIPDLHETMTNPLYFANDKPEYIKRVLRFPSFQIDSVADKTKKSLIEGCQEGSTVYISFIDSNLRRGHITGLKTGGNWSEAIKNSGVGGAAAAHNAGNGVYTEPDPTVAAYEQLNPGYFAPANVRDVNQPWSALDAAKSLVGGGARIYQDVVNTENPAPDLPQGWSVIQRWKNISLGDPGNPDDDTVPSSGASGHTYLAFKDSSGSVTIYESSTSNGWRVSPNKDWKSDVNNYGIGIQPINITDEQVSNLLGPTMFQAWVEGTPLPCCTMVACFLLEIKNPGIVSPGETPADEDGQAESEVNS